MTPGDLHRLGEKPNHLRATRVAVSDVEVGRKYISHETEPKWSPTTARPNNLHLQKTWIYLVY